MRPPLLFIPILVAVNRLTLEFRSLANTCCCHIRRSSSSSRRCLLWLCVENDTGIHYVAEKVAIDSFGWIHFSNNHVPGRRRGCLPNISPSAPSLCDWKRLLPVESSSGSLRLVENGSGNVPFVSSFKDGSWLAVIILRHVVILGKDCKEDDKTLVGKV